MLTIIPIDDIISQANVRIDLGDLDSLAASIGRIGIIQPPIVAPPVDEDGTYTLIAGHRRVAAAASLGHAEVACIIDDGYADAAAVIEAQYAENVYRKTLSAFEQLSVAWDLKKEGKKQADVAEIMGLAKADVSKMHKAYKALSSDDLDAQRASQLSAKALFEIADDVDPKAIVDVVRVIADGEARDVWQAKRVVEQELIDAEFYQELAADQKLWADMGVTVTTDNPMVTDEVDARGRAKAVPGVAYLRDTGIDLEDHIKLSCHLVWIKASNYTHPDVYHVCVNMKNHVPGTDGEAVSVVAERVVREAATKVEDSKARKWARESKKIRVAKAAVWMAERTNATAREQWQLHVAAKAWRSDHEKKAAHVLGYIGERETGADYNWYSHRFVSWAHATFGDADGVVDRTKLMRWKAQFIVAYDYIEGGYGHNDVFDAPIDAIELPDDDE